MNALYDAMDETMLAERMPQSLINKLIDFACQHDDGTPMPRAHYDEQADAVVIRSWSKAADGTVATESDQVRSMTQLRNVLGY